MQIFEAEKQAGLEEIIQANASICYATSVERQSDLISASQKKEIKAIAGVDDKDLYYTQSILVSTDWNKNDDIFDKAEVWKAKNTPEDKPTNIEHQESQIVGHIVANWPITTEGVIIDANTPIDNLPNKYHILTASVVYTGFTNPELRERSQKLISEIEDGTKYVSMECFFSGFDYGAVNKTTGEFSIIPRSEQTAFLTKHLRAYGGQGEFGDQKLGRVLRNITFSGKGFVDKPANPESIIFQKEDFRFVNDNQVEKNEEIEDTGVSTIQMVSIEENTMSTELDNVTQTEEKGEAMNDCSELVKEAYAARDELKTQASELETALKSEQEVLAEVRASVESLTVERDEAVKAKEEALELLASVKTELEAANEVVAAYKDKEAEMMKKEKDMKRKASLIEAGLDEEAAASKVEELDALEDATFEGVVSLLAMMKPKMDDSKKEEEMKKKEQEAMMMKKKASEDVSEVLENVEVEDQVDLSVGSDEGGEVDNTRAALIEFVYNRLGKTLNKGE